MADGSGRLATIRAALTPAEWHRVGAMAVAVVGLHVVGWGLLTLAVVGGHHQVSAGKAFGVGTGVLAYTLGMRHAFDADHIAAIDNTTRKLMADGKRPLSVGFFFSLGHSTIVVTLTLLLALGLRAIGAELTDDSSALHTYGGLIGTLVSGGFLYLLGLVNLVVLVGILKVFRNMRRGHYDEAALEEQLDNRGLMSRIPRPGLPAVRQPWQNH